MTQRGWGKTPFCRKILVLLGKPDCVSLHFNVHPTERKDKTTRNPKQTAWSYWLRLGAVGTDHGDCMCASRGRVIIVTGDGEGGAAMLSHHTDGTTQGLQVFWGQADLPTGRKRMSRERSGGSSESP